MQKMGIVIVVVKSAMGKYIVIILVLSLIKLLVTLSR